MHWCRWVSMWSGTAHSTIGSSSRASAGSAAPNGRSVVHWTLTGQVGVCLAGGRLAGNCTLPRFGPVAKVPLFDKHTRHPFSLEGFVMAESIRGHVYDDITQTIGNTPLIRLRRVVGDSKA